MIQLKVVFINNMFLFQRNTFQQFYHVQSRFYQRLFLIQQSREIIANTHNVRLLRLITSITMILTELSFISLMLAILKAANLCEFILYTLLIFDIKWWAKSLVIVELYKLQRVSMFFEQWDTKINIPAKLNIDGKIKYFLSLYSYIFQFLLFQCFNYSNLTQRFLKEKRDEILYIFCTAVVNYYYMSFNLL